MSFPYQYHKSEDGEATVTVLTGEGAPITVTEANPNFREIIEIVECNLPFCEHTDQELRELADLSEAVSARLTPLSPRVSVANGRLYFDGDEVHGALANHVLRCLESGTEDYRPFVAFMENVAANPQDHSREQLFDWLDQRDFTITEDGCFIGYKGVRKNAAGTFESITAGPGIVDGVPQNGHLPNNIGSTVELARSSVNFDPSQGCSVGLHVGSYDYAKSFGQDGCLLKVKVNPRDVVSVPTDCNWEKIRTCRYEVLDNIEDRVEVPVEYTTATAFPSLAAEAEEIAHDNPYELDDRDLLADDDWGY